MNAYKVVGFDDFGIDFDDEEVILSSGYEYFEPEPLTEEWLIKFRFRFIKQKSGTQGIYSNGKMNLTLSNSGNVYYNKKYIPYVHKLQNLYFELKDEEL
jgi:hypothetical protein